MLSSSTSSPSDDREVRIQALLQTLRGDADAILRRMAEALVDLPEDQFFGQIELTLRDLGRDLAASAHEAGLKAEKKKATKAPASSVRTASPTPASSAIGPRPFSPPAAT